MEKTNKEVFLMKTNLKQFQVETVGIIKISKEIFRGKKIKKLFWVKTFGKQFHMKSTFKTATRKQKIKKLLLDGRNV